MSGNSVKNLMGVWDFKKAASNLGFILIYLEELSLQQQLYEDRSVDLVFVQDKHQLDHIYLSMLSQFLPRLDSLFFFKSRKYFDDFFEWRQARYKVWPSKISLNRTSYSGSTLSLQDNYKKLGRLIPLSTSPSQTQSALSWLQRHIPDKAPIVVHLKNSNTDPKSNANLDNWLDFFNICYRLYPDIIFLLIGHDPVDDHYQKCPNVLMTKSHGSNLELDLSLIINGFMFMGMSSGPCNMALFCGVPYLIWKHPDHHAREMKREFQGHSQFIFADKYQKFMIEWDTSENLLNEFNMLLSQLDQKVWFDKFNWKINNV